MTTQYVSRHEGRLAYEVRGSGPTVLCLPSLGDIRAEYRSLVPRLASVRTVTANLRGHGDSDATFTRYAISDLADDLIALLDATNVERAVIAASSISGASALLAAARHPERIAGLVLLAPVARDLPNDRFFRPIAPLMFARPWGAWMWTSFYRTLTKRTTPEGHQEHCLAVHQSLRGPGRLRALVKMIRASKEEVELSWREVRCPTSIAMGTADPDFPNPREEAERLAAGLGSSPDVTLFDGVGHYPHLEDPDRVAAMVMRMIDRTATESSAAAR